MNPGDVPSIKPDVNIKILDISPEQGFLLSRIDGQTSIDELSMISGTSKDELIKQIKPLVDNGVLELKKSVAQIAEEKKFAREIIKLYDNLENMDHFKLLGVRRKASEDDLQKAFIKLTKRYHPDRLFRTDDVDLRKKLQAVFARINDAHKVLLNPEKREEYEYTLSDVYEEEEASQEPEQEGEQEDKPPPKKVKPKRKLRPKPKPENPFDKTIQQARRIFDMGMHEVKKRNYSSAKTNIRLAMQLDPYNKTYPRELEKIAQLQNKQQAKEDFGKGEIYEKDRNFKKAISSYRSAIQLDPNEPRYLVAVAKVLLVHQNKSFEAKPLLLKATDLDARVAEPHYLLGRVYVASSLKVAAVKEFELAAELEPKNKDIQKTLKKARKM